MTQLHAEALKVLTSHARTLDGMSEPLHNAVTQFSADQNKARAVALRASIWTLEAIDAISGEMVALKASHAALLADLTQAAATLRRYETLHRAKSTADSTEKAEVNAALAARFEATIAQAVQP